MKKVSRFKIATILLIGSFAAALLIGLLLAGVTYDPGENFAAVLWKSAKLFYMWFLGAFPVAVLLLVFSKIPEDLAVIYGAGLYYGTILCRALISDYVSASDTTCTVIGLIIAALICRILYLKQERK